MKKTVFAFLLITVMVQGQSFNYDKLFIEGGAGAGFPLSQFSPTGNGSGSISLIHFQGSLRYMLNENIGLIGSLGYDSFKNNDDQNSKQKLASLELVYNIGNALEVSGNTGNFALLAHGGLGAGELTGYRNPNDYIGAIIIGVKPLWPLNDKVSVFVDATYKQIIDQDIYYNGADTTYPNPGKLTSGQFGLTFGIIASLGKNRTNADFFHIR
ncbi:hypothetical protein [Flavobacterium sp. WC2509]|uniref:hypothetical protein n=1 Tax=Flavobacterium sp. WC2509 TaxID=3461406 RepID=UPI0040439BFC